MASNPFEDIVLQRLNISNIELRSNASVGSIILHSTNPSESTPSVWIDINIPNKRLTFYKDVGNGWASVGNVSIT